MNIPITCPVCSGQIVVRDDRFHKNFSLNADLSVTADSPIRCAKCRTTHGANTTFAPLPDAWRHMFLHLYDWNTPWFDHSNVDMTAEGLATAPDIHAGDEMDMDHEAVSRRIRTLTDAGIAGSRIAEIVRDAGIRFDIAWEAFTSCGYAIGLPGPNEPDSLSVSDTLCDPSAPDVTLTNVPWR